MLLFMSGAGKAHSNHLREILNKCQNLLFYLQLEATGRALFRT
jgi:hypothetical protein